jgi:hypothetical protein
MSESHDETYVAPDPPEIPPPVLILIVVAARAAEVIRPKNKKASIKGLAKEILTSPLQKNNIKVNPRFTFMVCRDFTFFLKG